MKDLGNINISRSQIEVDLGKEPKLIHKRKGAIIKFFYYGSGDKYYVEDVIYEGNDFNIISDDKTIYENQSGSHHFDELIESQVPFKQVCKQLNAEWYACVNGVHYACQLK
jgi:hypothetical protein